MSTCVYAIRYMYKQVAKKTQFIRFSHITVRNMNIKFPIPSFLNSILEQNINLTTSFSTPGFVSTDSCCFNKLILDSFGGLLLDVAY